MDLSELKRMDNDGLLVSSSLYYEEVYELYSSLKSRDFMLEGAMMYEYNEDICRIGYSW